MANASTPSRFHAIQHHVVLMHQTHVRVHSLLDGKTHSLAVLVNLELSTAQPTDTVRSTVLSSNDAMGTKAGSPASPVPIFCSLSIGSLATRPGLRVRGRSSRETGNALFLVTRPGVAPGVVGPSTVSLPPNKLKGEKTISPTRRRGSLPLQDQLQINSNSFVGT
jgi:hypothetical protein